MKVMMMVTWFTSRDAEVLLDGVFHYEQSMALKKYADMALYYPFDQSSEKGLVKNMERGLLTYRFAPKHQDRARRFPEILKGSIDAVKDYKPDIIHAHVAAGAGVIAVIVGKILHIPVIVTEHNPIELSHFDQKINRMLVDFVYRRTYANICVSKDSKDRLSVIFPKCKFHVIYNGIENPETIPADEESYAVPGRVNFAIVAAFYSKEIKGYQFLLPAIAALKEKGYSLMLHVCGGGDYLDYYKQMAKDLDIEDSVTFYGQCERKKVYSIVRQMQFTVSASIFECSGVSVQEAMLLGKPLVVTKSGGANSLVTDRTAIVVDRESTKALTDGIEEMLKELEAEEFKSEEIRDYAYGHFEIDEVSKRYMKLYRKCLSKK
jgi:glycosyltransferase involved in cell wall biosynthesis